MIEKIVLYESIRVDNFYPISVMHSLWEIRIGAFLNFEKYKILFPNAAINFHGRKKHLNSFLARFEILQNAVSYEDVLFIDSALVPDSKVLSEIVNSELFENTIFKNEENYIYAFYIKQDDSLIKYINGNDLIDSSNMFFKEYKVKYLNANIMYYLWDTLDYVEIMINDDKKYIDIYDTYNSKRFSFAAAINSENIHIGKDVHIAPNVVLDAEKGPIIIDDNVRIMPQATIIGPCYIGKNSIIKIGAKIYENNSFGDWCKIGGEIENSIIQGFSNKQHDGFLGHSYLGEWVNLGADTNCSDLKNTYSVIKVNLNGENVDTGRMFLGVLCGDHTKTGINSMFTTGTIAGICGILVRDWFLPNFIQSFSWGGKNDSPKYKLKNAIETAKIVKKRRGKELLNEEIILLTEEYNKV